MSMTDAAETKERLPPRLRRILEVVYAIEGVAEARVWEWEKSVAVGVRPMAGTFAPDSFRVEPKVPSAAGANTNEHKPAALRRVA